jgi:hypothetical protein
MIGNRSPDHIPAPNPALRVVPALAIGPSGLNAAADPVVPGFRRGGSPFGPIGQPRRT